MGNFLIVVLKLQAGIFACLASPGSFSDHQRGHSAWPDVAHIRLYAAFVAWVPFDLWSVICPASSNFFLFEYTYHNSALTKQLPDNCRTSDCFQRIKHERLKLPAP
jgi:hypothetical protein